MACFLFQGLSLCGRHPARGEKRQGSESVLIPGLGTDEGTVLGIPGKPFQERPGEVEHIDGLKMGETF